MPKNLFTIEQFTRRLEKAKSKQLWEAPKAEEDFDKTLQRLERKYRGGFILEIPSENTRYIYSGEKGGGGLWQKRSELIKKTKPKLI